MLYEKSRKRYENPNGEEEGAKDLVRDLERITTAEDVVKELREEYGEMEAVDMQGEICKERLRESETHYGDVLDNKIREIYENLKDLVIHSGEFEGLDEVVLKGGRIKNIKFSVKNGNVGVEIEYDSYKNEVGKKLIFDCNKDFDVKTKIQKRYRPIPIECCEEIINGVLGGIIGIGGGIAGMFIGWASGCSEQSAVYSGLTGGGMGFCSPFIYQIWNNNKEKIFAKRFSLKDLGDKIPDKKEQIEILTHASKIPEYLVQAQKKRLMKRKDYVGELESEREELADMEEEINGLSGGEDKD